jgi:hypothetical protein
LNYSKPQWARCKNFRFNWIYELFSNEKGVSRVHGPVDRYPSRSSVGSRPGQGGKVTGAWSTTATEGGSSPWEHLEEEGAEGILTTTLVGAGQHGLVGYRRLGVATLGARYGDPRSLEERSKGRGGWRQRLGLHSGSLL